MKIDNKNILPIDKHLVVDISHKGNGLYCLFDINEYNIGNDYEKYKQIISKFKDIEIGFLYDPMYSDDWPNNIPDNCKYINTNDIYNIDHKYWVTYIINDDDNEFVNKYKYLKDNFEHYQVAIKTKSYEDAVSILDKLNADYVRFNNFNFENGSINMHILCNDNISGHFSKNQMPYKYNSCDLMSNNNVCNNRFYYSNGLIYNCPLDINALALQFDKASNIVSSDSGAYSCIMTRKIQ